MNDQMMANIRAAVAESRRPDDVIRVFSEDLKDLIDAWDFYNERRNKSPLWLPDGTATFAEKKPFTKRLHRLIADSQASIDVMTSLFHRVEYANGKQVLFTAFGHVMRAMAKISDETMAVHREHFNCSEKDES